MMKKHTLNLEKFWQIWKHLMTKLINFFIPLSEQKIFSWIIVSLHQVRSISPQCKRNRPTGTRNMLLHRGTDSDHAECPRLAHSVEVHGVVSMRPCRRCSRYSVGGYGQHPPCTQVSPLPTECEYQTTEWWVMSVWSATAWRGQSLNTIKCNCAS